MFHCNCVLAMGGAAGGGGSGGLASLLSGGLGGGGGGGKEHVAFIPVKNELCTKTLYNYEHTN